jgi:ATPase involved in DNA replication initiation
MTKPQLPLQLQIAESSGFDDFIGHDEVVVNLKNYSDLPSFCYLWGAPSSGKSHLLSAYSQYRQQNDEIGALFSATVLLETDMSEMMQPKWCFVVFDDIHLIAGDDLGERHLFNVFNACRAGQVPMLVAAQISPRNPNWQLPDLRSRLHSGLTLELSVLKRSSGHDFIQASI